MRPATCEKLPGRYRQTKKGIEIKMEKSDVIIEHLNQYPKDRPVILAIDGPCGSGKSTLGEFLTEIYDGNLIHMDDFFLPPKLRTKGRLAEPGGNVHYERFMEEIVIPLKKLRQGEFSLQNSALTLAEYRVFNCKEMSYEIEKKKVVPKYLTVIEGAYSMRPEFQFLYDTSVFLTISPQLQKERLLARNGEQMYQNFVDRWIPMENQYFKAYDIAGHCNLLL